MSKRYVMADGSTLDMLSAESIRDYITGQLAQNVTPSSAQLKRLEMLEARAAQLESKQPKPVAAEPTVADLSAARERLRKARGT
jgi:hypothetical protein